MIWRGLIRKEDIDIITPLLDQVYAVGYDLGLKRQQKGKAVVQFSLGGKPIKVYNSTLEAALAVGVHYDNIRKAARGVQHTSMGYTWKYVDSM